MELLRHQRIRVVELSALRLSELDELVSALDHLDLSEFEWVSFHAPSRFTRADESHVLRLLHTVAARGIPVIAHPDMIFTDQRWEPMGAMLVIENMDKRKPTGRTAADMIALFERFPTARLCFDIGHARQVDPTMTEARLILDAVGDRLAQAHISEVNTSSRHDPLSIHSIPAFQRVAAWIPEHVPIILETLIDEGQSDIPTEIERARLALDSSGLLVGGA